jgi:lipopolysaccharide biosynthesis glycosyltransferase
VYCLVSDDPLHVVSIINYPRDQNYLRMAYAFLDSVIAHGGQQITLLYEDNPPVIAPEHREAANIEVVQGKQFDVGHPHFNLRFKLPNLASLTFPFLFLDADMYVLDDLNYLWQRRSAKPWIAIDHQRIPIDPRTHRSPFLNSGLQLVSDPNFYDLDAILAVQNAAMPLSKFREVRKVDMFSGPGHDQAVLHRYLTTIGYDYTHPEIGTRWNSCAGITDVCREGDNWKAHTRTLTDNHDVSILHYWDQFKPWVIDCPIYQSYARVDERLAEFLS